MPVVISVAWARRIQVWIPPTLPGCHMGLNLETCHQAMLMNQGPSAATELGSGLLATALT